MTEGLLYEGIEVSYDELISGLREGEMLVATWLYDPTKPIASVLPTARGIMSSS